MRAIPSPSPISPVGLKGIVRLIDTDGNLLGQEEPFHHGSPMLPVNWRGDGQEVSILPANMREKRRDRRVGHDTGLKAAGAEAIGFPGRAGSG